MFKAASVTPLIKKADLDEDTSANFRPISNLNNISKLIGRLFLSHLQPQILDAPHFDHLQSAYRPHHSTETALLLSFNNIYQAADNSQPSLLVSLDLSAAFDIIDHSRLLSRLQTSFGISDTALSWR
jgi:retron-type reverse transcriptase